MAVRGVLLGAVIVLVMSCGGSAPTNPTPTNSGGARTLTISGTTTLGPGGTSQLSASIISGSGTTTPSAVTWQTVNASIAAVTAGGLLTGVGVGQTFVSATADGLFAQSVVTVEVTTTGAPGTAITACGTIVASGAYVLTQDLVAGSSPCESFSNTSSIQLDCQGHFMFGLALTNVTGATVQGCKVTDKVTMTNVTSVTLSRSTVQSEVVVNQSSSVMIADNTLSSVRVMSASGVQVLRDAIAPQGVFYAVEFKGGMNNQVLQSTITGGWTGAGETGADDGVLLENEAGDTIQGNTITSFFDTAVEGVDAVANTTIADNTGSNLGVVGVGSFWCTAWTNNIIRGNHISNAEGLGLFTYVTDGFHCELTISPPALTGNQFVGNVFRNTTNTLGAMLEVDMPGNVSGNLVQGNDFGPNGGPHLVPLSGFIDGGGNVCGPMNPLVSNFPCTGGTVVSRVRR